MLPPNSVTIPRTELPMEQLLNIHSANLGDGSRKGNFKKIMLKYKNDRIFYEKLINKILIMHF